MSLSSHLDCRAALVSALLSDFIGRRMNFVLFAAGAIVTVFAFVVLVNERIILVLAFSLGFFASGAFSGMGALFTEVFPTCMRGFGAGFAYNFGRGFGVLILWLVGAGLFQGTSAISPLGLSIGVFVSIAYGLVIIAALAFPETKGKKLEEVDAAYPLQEFGGARPPRTAGATI